MSPRLRARLAGLTLALLCASCGDDTAAGGGGAGGTPAAGGGGAGPEGGGGEAPGGAPATGGGGQSEGGGGGSGGEATTTITTTPCDTDNCDLTIEGSGFGQFDGMTISFALVEQGQPDSTIAPQTITIAGGSFEASAPGALEKGVSYFLPYYIDLNGNAECDITPTDAVWRLSLPTVDSHVHVSIVFDAGGMSNLGCGPFP